MTSIYLIIFALDGMEIGHITGKTSAVCDQMPAIIETLEALWGQPRHRHPVPASNGTAMMTEEQINAVAVMRRAGNSNGEIAQTLGMSYDQVGTAVFRARQRNILPPKPPAKPRQAVLDLVKGNGLRQGRISDMMIELSKAEKVWLIGETQRDGYETIAEWLTDLVRSQYDKENELG